MMKDLKLLYVSTVTDDSTGIWRVGELEFGVMIGPMKDYLEGDPKNREELADWLQMLSNKCRNDEAPFQV